ncbi:l-threonine-o-3-phosphate decarboxylase, putative [Heliomicrobium modesticaldum Ice1]|uniref:Aminotransferase n=1 Tax=Heliobacterium modesticaldum (strain ATCC 51547 / Ice1) TaxID=498761 RepID=B0TIL3_HELMI|nr:aminotransferase class I/II-fold pyridoxal phosphate-dependent enzyme [Heliomicrobium modesticaldum]ABZ84954.1 l-threonine-o-3-phosphate decarboxylase, putative [Heliomicrobium modesticaldum Ice1]
MTAKKAESAPYRHGGDVWSATWDGKIPMEEILDLSANINFLGLSPLVRQAIVESIDQVVHYPDPKCRRLIEALADHLTVPPESICAGNGAVDLLDHWLHAVQARRVLIPEPGFGQYERAVVAQGGVAVPLPLDEKRQFRLDVEAWKKALREEGCDTAILCTPHNPAGWVWTEKEKQAVLAHLESSPVRLLVDESFLDFLPDGRALSCCPQASENDRLAVLYSLTKFFAIPGLRLGALITDSDIIKGIVARRDPWVVNQLAQAAGVAALADRDYHQKTWEQLPQERNYLFEQLSKLPGLTPLPSDSNFSLLYVAESGISSTGWTERLRRRGILVRNCNTFLSLGERYLRLAVRDKAATDRLIEAMRAVLAEEGML